MFTDKRSEYFYLILCIGDFMQLQVITKSDFSEIVPYNNPNFPVYVRRAFLSYYPDYTAVSHWHDDLEFILMLTGYMDYNINGEIVRMHAGEGIFVNSRQLHFGFSTAHDDCDFVCYLLHPVLLSASAYAQEHFVLPLLTNTDFPYSLLRPDIPWQKQILQDLEQLYLQKETPFFTLQSQSLFFDIFWQLSENAPVSGQKGTLQYDQLSSLNIMIGYIQKNYTEKLTLNDIADAGHVCKSTCSNLFQSKLNCSPISYLNRYRLNKSIDLLNFSSMSITKIGYEVGFSGASYFSEIFRKYFGCTPTEYRQQAEKQPD